MLGKTGGQKDGRVVLERFFLDSKWIQLEYYRERLRKTKLSQLSDRDSSFRLCLPDLRSP